MASGIINTGSNPRLLLEGIKKLFGLNYDQLEMMHSKIYKTEKSSKNFETMVGLAGLGMATLKNEGEPIQLDDMSQSYSRITRHNVYAQRVRVTKEAIDDNLYLKYAPVLSKELAKALVHAKEVNAAALFNNPTSTSAPFLGADGKAFLATDHPAKKGGVYSNRVASDFSEASLEAAIIQMYGWIGDDGLRISVKPKGLLIPTQLSFDAHRVLKSNLQSGTANNDANALKDMNMLQNIMPWRFLTDTDAWFILTDQDGLVHYEREGITFDTFKDDLTNDVNFKAHERYSFDYYDPRCVIGSIGV